MHPLPRKRVGLWTLACGWGGWGTQFVRLDRKPCTLYTLCPCCFPIHGGGETHSLEGEGVGGPNSYSWIESLALCILWALFGKCSTTTEQAFVRPIDQTIIFVPSPTCSITFINFSGGASARRPAPDPERGRADPRGTLGHRPGPDSLRGTCPGLDKYEPIPGFTQYTAGGSQSTVRSYSTLSGFVMYSTVPSTYRK